LVVPVMPVSSCTVAPASSRTSRVIWPSTSCSVNSLEPTVNSAPDRASVLAPPPPPSSPQAVVASARAASIVVSRTAILE
jgi:hypothetical protein